ncbi:MAG: methyltransferase domain-containing protein, partial [Chthoniobacterales bacterium]
NCGSTPRARAIIRVLSTELFGDNLLLPDFPTHREIRGLGMTDWKGTAVKLAEKFDYRNTYYHKEPKLDISTGRVAAEFLENDFILSSDVFEHVAPPVSQAFENVWKMLKPGGVLVLTVPYGTQEETVEHFPELNEFSLVKKDGSFVLRNKTKAGVVQEFNDLVFHGGPGSTLEMRIFSENALIQHLNDAEFADIKVHRTADLVHGIWWPEPWAFPVSARKPGAQTPGIAIKDHGANLGLLREV